MRSALLALMASCAAAVAPAAAREMVLHQGLRFRRRRRRLQLRQRGGLFIIQVAQGGGQSLAALAGD